MYTDILQVRYGTELVAFSITRQFYKDGGVTKARISGTERAADL